jgi:hypothetical protein
MVEIIEVSEVEFWDTVEAYKNKSLYDDSAPIDFIYMDDDPSEYEDFNPSDWDPREDFDDSAFETFADDIPF